MKTVKHYVSLFFLACFLLTTVNPTMAATKEVCRVVKTTHGKIKSVCKKIKVHKKLVGTKVPSKKK